MEYVWSDKDGRTRDFFNSREGAISALREEERERPGLTKGWMLLTYGDDGEELGELEWAEDLLAASCPPKAGIAFTLVAEGAGLYVVGPQAAKSGTKSSTRRGFRRPPKVAKGTRAPSEAEMAGAK
jgi:hypothetical protein